MSTNYSFTNFNQPKAYVEGTEYKDVVKKPTERQVQYYLDLCVQRRVAPQNYTKMTYDELAKVIEELRKFYPASEAQINIIKDKVASLNALGKTIIEPNYATLTGGREGSASKLIEMFITMEKELSNSMQPTDKQIEFLVGMYLCPDVPFEKHEVNKTVDLGNGQWRKLTPDEFAEEIKSKMSKAQASKFIDDYRGAFHTWKTTRVRPEQVKYIRDLEARMSNLTPTTAIEWAIDEEGNLVQVIKKAVDKSKVYAPTAYVAIDELELMMYSVQEASKYIDILKAELENKKLTKYGELSDESQTFEPIRKASNGEKKLADDVKELQDLMFKLEAVAGYADDDLHDSVSELLFNDEVDYETLREQKEKIRLFMLSLVEDGSTSFDGLTELCQKSEVAQSILLGI